MNRSFTPLLPTFPALSHRSPDPEAFRTASSPLECIHSSEFRDRKDPINLYICKEGIGGRESDSHWVY